MTRHDPAMGGAERSGQDGGKPTAEIPERRAVVVPARVLGLDGKTYPSSPRTPEARASLVGLVHRLSHDGRTIRQVVDDDLAGRGQVVSVGSAHGWLRDWVCPACRSGVPNGAPEHETSPERALLAALTWPATANDDETGAG